MKEIKVYTLPVTKDELLKDIVLLDKIRGSFVKFKGRSRKEYVLYIASNLQFSPLSSISHTKRIFKILLKGYKKVIYSYPCKESRKLFKKSNSPSFELARAAKFFDIPCKCITTHQLDFHKRYRKEMFHG